MKYIIIIALFFISAATYAQSGRIDKNFRSRSRIQTDFFNRGDYINALALQADGKIVAVGSSSNSQSTADIAVARYFSNGELDTSFGMGGKFLSGLDKSHYDCQSVLMQQDGKIVLVGSVWDTLSPSTPAFFIHRLNANGTTDLTFGHLGETTLHIPYSQNNTYTSSILQMDGKILIAGYAEGLSMNNYINPSTIVIARYNQDGILDSSFAKGGIIANDLNSDSYEGIQSLALQSDGKILAGGYITTLSNSYKLTLRRFNSNGTPDISFGTNGEVIMRNRNGGAEALLLRSDGKIIVSCGGDWINSPLIQLIQFTQDGNLDFAFGKNGIASASIPPLQASLYLSSGATTLLLQANGKVFAVAPSSGSVFVLFLFNANGSVDSTFQQQGEEIFDTINYNQNWGNHTSALLQNDKILLAGAVIDSNTSDFGLRRLNLDGNLDTSFISYTSLITSKFPTDDIANTISISPSDRIILGGYSDASVTNADLLGMRYEKDGNIDSTFWSEGKFVQSDNLKYVTVNSSAIQFDSVVYFAGSIYDPARFDIDFIFLRAATFRNFSIFSSTRTDFGGGSNYCRSLLRQPDEKIILSGYVFTGRNYDFALARYSENGNLDSTFGTNGKVTTDIGVNQDYAYASALQTDGKIVLCGTTYNDKQWQIAHIRYNSNGSLDHSFGSSGIVLTALHDSDDEAKSIAIQSDGKIIVAGYTRNGKNNNFALVRYNTNGNIDSTFGKSGIVETSIGNGNAEACGVVIEKNGRIVAAGYSSNGKDDDFTLACYNSDGSLDKNFGTGGITTTDFGFGDDHGNAVALQSDGAIVVAGYAFNGKDKDYAVARYLPDLSFGIVDRKPTQNITTIYPNPIHNTATLQYELTHAQPVTIKLFDVLGNERATFINNEIRSEGKNSEQIIFPNGIASGTYFLQIDTREGFVSVKVVKE